MTEQVLDMSGGGFAEPSGCSHSVRISFVLHSLGSDDGIVAAAPEDLRCGGIFRCLHTSIDVCVSLGSSCSCALVCSLNSLGRWMSSVSLTLS